MELNNTVAVAFCDFGRLLSNVLCKLSNSLQNRHTISCCCISTLYNIHSLCKFGMI